VLVHGDTHVSAPLVVNLVVKDVASRRRTMARTRVHRFRFGWLTNDPWDTPLCHFLEGREGVTVSGEDYGPRYEEPSLRPVEAGLRLRRSLHGGRDVKRSTTHGGL
jgi:hypothetical protein